MRDGRMRTSAEMPRRACRRRIMLIDKPLLRLRTSATRVRVPIIGSRFAVELHGVAHLQPRDARCQVDIVCDEQRAAVPDFQDEALMPVAVIIVRQHADNGAAAMDLLSASRRDERVI